MRIGYDAKRLFCNFTGLGNYSRNNIVALRELFPGNDYVLFTPKVRVNDVTRPFLDMEGVEVKTPETLVKGGLWRTCLLSGLLAKEHIDVFHGLSHELPFGIDRSGVASVVTIHDVAFKTFPQMYHWHDRQIYDLKMRYACRHADRIVAISESTKHDVMRFYGVEESKIDVVYQPVQDIYYTPMRRDEAQTLVQAFAPGLPHEFMLYVGSVNSRKNLLGIVKAMERIPVESRLPLVIVGNGREYKLQVEQFIAEHGMEKYFFWLSNLKDNHQLQALYTLALVFLYPSFYEGFGLPVVEALLSGCPVVTSNISSLPEAGGDASALVNPSSDEEIADAIKGMLSLSDEERKSKVSAGRDYAERMFRPDAIARQLMDVYQRAKQ